MDSVAVSEAVDPSSTLGIRTRETELQGDGQELGIFTIVSYMGGPGKSPAIHLDGVGAEIVYHVR